MTLYLNIGELRAFGIDFGHLPELRAGETISNPSVAAVSGLTIGTPTILSVAHDGVAAGKGVKVTITSSTAGTYTVKCTVTTSGSATLIEKHELVVS